MEYYSFVSILLTFFSRSLLEHKVFFYFTHKLLRSSASGGPHIEPQYRQYPQITKKQKFESELISGVMWFWILWHCWHDPDAVLVSIHYQVAVALCNMNIKESRINRLVSSTPSLFPLKVSSPAGFV